MSLLKNTSFRKWGIISVSFVIVAAILWNTFDFIQKFKVEERRKMEIIAGAYGRFNDNSNLNTDITLESEIVYGNHNIPMIVTDEQNNITQHHFLDAKKTKDSSYVFQQLALMKKENQPLIIGYRNNSKQYIYYRDSDLLNKLKYYPLALIFILFLFASVIFLFFKSNKSAEQNKLWTGMAKETAHQIGTPLTSLLGWVEILRLEGTEKTTVDEIEKDIHRLNTIAERFSKIGSIPTLTNQNIVESTAASYHYLKSRSSKQVAFSFKTSDKVINTPLNIQLYSWVIENLIKNAIDAMEGKGNIAIEISRNEQGVKIFISDDGKGIPKNLQQTVFNPGFTTKKRGWGLGLSLAKRIIEDYHKGHIFVLKSAPNKGTTFCISLKESSLS
ncbi:MAG: two-component sensor histidine kinase [Flavobacteriaceae bacterium]|nr:MAG: two-component sensor histidine kinase [Flavobacteriaceae bacterium]